MLRLPASRRWVEALRRRLYRYVASSDYRNAGPLRDTLKYVLAEDLSPYIPKIRSKALLIWGDRDEETPLEIGRKMAALIPDNELVIFSDSGHFPYLDQTNKFVLLANRFFRQDQESC
jgi:pimeloyl-ACP methyl ester carboxylesterase